MSVQTTGTFPKLMWPGLKSIWGISYAQYPEQWRRIFDVETSSKAWEEDVGISSYGLFSVKDEGDAVKYDTELQGHIARYTHVTYALGGIISEEAQEDDQYAVVGRRKARALAFSSATTLNTLGAAVYNNSTTYTGADGAALLSDTHVNVSGDSTAVDNLSASTLSESALEAACIAISKFTNDRGLRIMATPTQLIVPPDLSFTAERILQSPLRPDTANNDLNAIKEMGVIPGGYVVNNYLTGTTSWYLRTNVPDGMKCYLRRAPTFSPDGDFDTGNMKFKATFRVSFGWTDWRGLYGYDV